MNNVDLKDRKILYELDINSRQSFSKIGKKIGLPKKSVEERVNKLIDDEIIKNFYTVIDVYKLGFIIMRFHYKYQYTTKKLEDEIINYFIDDKNSVLIASCHGPINLKVIRVINDINEFYEHWNKAQKKFGYYFQNRSSALFVDEMYYDCKFLLDNNLSTPREKVTLLGRGKRIDIDEFNFELLKKLSDNARISIYDLAEYFNTTAINIRDAINFLKKNGIIRGFRINIDFQKLNYSIFRAHIFLNDYNMRNNIINYVKINPNLVFIDTYTGQADLELEFYLKSINEYNNIINELSSNFQNSIKNFQSLHINKYHKFLYMPETR